jgi:IPT/TIG domain
MTPRTGPPGTRAVITGDHLTTVLAVCFGTRAATGLRFGASGLKLTVTVPAGSGTVVVTVIVKSGRSGRLTTFRYQGPAGAGATAPAPGGVCATTVPEASS